MRSKTTRRSATGVDARSSTPAYLDDIPAVPAADRPPPPQLPTTWRQAHPACLDCQKSADERNDVALALFQAQIAGLKAEYQRDVDEQDVRRWNIFEDLLDDTARTPRNAIAFDRAKLSAGDNLARALRKWGATSAAVPALSAEIATLQARLAELDAALLACQTAAGPPRPASPAADQAQKPPCPTNQGLAGAVNNVACQEAR